MEMDSKNTGNFFSGLLVGALIGLAVGFLYAPQSGEETREQLVEKAKKAKEKAEELAQKVKSYAEEAKQKIKEAS
jgi:gas vesicle protein